MCDGKNRLKAEGEMLFFPEGGGKPTPKTDPIFLAAENWCVFTVIILIIRQGAIPFLDIPCVSQGLPHSAIE